jgi:hypothetical protein
MALNVITGKNGDIYRIVGASTPITAEACSAVTALPGDDTVYPANQIFKITARAHKLLDPRVPIVVKDGATVKKATDYFVRYGSGYIQFYTPLGGTPAITVDGAYISTASGTDIQHIPNAKNWQLNLTADQADASAYGVRIKRKLRGLLDGTWQFDKYADGPTLLNQMQAGSYFFFAFYEDITVPRLWVFPGDFTSQPITNPIDAAAMGTVNGTMLEAPEYLNEAL